MVQADILDYNQQQSTAREMRRRKVENKENSKEQENKSLRERVVMARRMKNMINKKKQVSSAINKVKTAKKVFKYGRMLWIIISGSIILLWFFAFLTALALIIMISSWMGEYSDAGLLKKGWMLIKSVWSLLNGKFPVLENLF